MNTELTMEEAVQSLNYYDRRAIKKEFGVSASDDNPDQLDLITGVAWIVAARENPGVKAEEFKKMPVGEIEAFFASDDADPLGGKSETTQTATSLNGASTPASPPVSIAS